MSSLLENDRTGAAARDELNVSRSVEALDDGDQSQTGRHGGLDRRRMKFERPEGVLAAPPAQGNDAHRED